MKADKFVDDLINRNILSENSRSEQIEEMKSWPDDAVATYKKYVDENHLPDKKLQEKSRTKDLIKDLKNKAANKTSQFLYFLSDKINFLQMKVTGKPTFDEVLSAYGVVNKHFNSILQANMNKFVGRLFNSNGSPPSNCAEWAETDELVSLNKRSDLTGLQRDILNKYSKKQTPEEKMSRGKFQRVKSTGGIDYFGNRCNITEIDDKIIELLDKSEYTFYKLDDSSVSRSWKMLFLTVKSLVRSGIIKSDNFNKLYSRLVYDNHSSDDIKEFCELLKNEYKNVKDKKFIKKYGKIMEDLASKNNSEKSNENEDHLVVKDDTIISEYVEDLRKYKNLVARLSKSYNLDKTLNKSETSWHISDENECLASLSVNELTNDHAEELFDYVTTKEFGQHIIDTINLMGRFRAQEFFKSDAERLLKEYGRVKSDDSSALKFKKTLNYNYLNDEKNNKLKSKSDLILQAEEPAAGNVIYNLQYLLDNPSEIDISKFIYVINQSRYHSMPQALLLVKVMTQKCFDNIKSSQCYPKTLELSVRYIVDYSQNFDECYEFLDLIYNVFDDNSDYDNKQNDEYKLKTLIGKYSADFNQMINDL